jgi:hypothetical protein
LGRFRNYHTVPKDSLKVPHCTAFQRADRLALLAAIEDFHKLLAGIGSSEEALKLGFLIRRCEYEGRPADMKTLAIQLGWKEPKVSHHFRELETWGFWKDEDKRDTRRKIARIPRVEHPIITAFYDNCLKVVDQLVLDREAAKQHLPKSDPWSWITAAVARTAKVAACLIPVLGGAWLDGCFATSSKAPLVADNDDDDDEGRDDDDSHIEMAGPKLVAYTKGGHVRGSVVSPLRFHHSGHP